MLEHCQQSGFDQRTALCGAETNVRSQRLASVGCHLDRETEILKPTHGLDVDIMQAVSS
jgi:hypothetical protein